MYKCDYCEYITKRLSNFRRHENRKKPCYNKMKVTVCKIEVPKNVNADQNVMEKNDQNPENVNARQKIPENVNARLEFCKKIPENVNVAMEKITENVNVAMEKITENVNADLENIDENYIYKCDKCNKEFKRKDNMKIHQAKCNGLHPLQCAICLKMFASRVGKANHKKYVKCNPLIINTNIQEGGSTSSNFPSIQNNGTMNIDNSVNITNNININIRGNFDKISNEDIERIINQVEKSEYLEMMNTNLKSGKYAVPRTIEQIYFNDDFPGMQTLKKERRNDKMVEVHIDGKWEKRLVEDILGKLIRKVEEYHNEYFRYLQEKYKNVPIGSAKWNKLVRPIKSFGHMMLWYDGFKGEEIEKLGIELNSPDDDKEKKKKSKDMGKIIKEKVYDKCKGKSVLAQKNRIIMI